MRTTSIISSRAYSFNQGSLSPPINSSRKKRRPLPIVCFRAFKASVLDSCIDSEETWLKNYISFSFSCFPLKMKPLMESTSQEASSNMLSPIKPKNTCKELKRWTIWKKSELTKKLIKHFISICGPTWHKFKVYWTKEEPCRLNNWHS